METIKTEEVNDFLQGSFISHNGKTYFVRLISPKIGSVLIINDKTNERAYANYKIDSNGSFCSLTIGDKEYIITKLYYQLVADEKQGVLEVQHSHVQMPPFSHILMRPNSKDAGLLRKAKGENFSFGKPS